MNRHVSSEPLSPDALEAALRAVGPERYHDLHPFHDLLHGGKLNKGQVQAWALNRYVYQAAIPRKDASLIGRCDDRELRREWLHRITDHDGVRRGQGRHRALADPDRRARARSRLRREPGGRAAGDQVRGRGLCPFRAREAARRGGRLEPHGAVRAVDPSPAASTGCWRTTTSSTRKWSPISAAGSTRRRKTPTSPSST